MGLAFKWDEKKPDDMLPEYDFASMTGGVRGKYYQAYREGHTVEIYKANGPISVQHFRLEDGAVMLDTTDIEDAYLSQR